MRAIRRLGVALLAGNLVLGMTAATFAHDACMVPDLGLAQSDVSRLENLDTSRTRGLGAALNGENENERAIVAAIFEPGLAPVDAELLEGRYRCRTIKLGGLGPLVVYQWFQCEIGREEGTFTIRKVTGSQNFFGTLMPTGSGYAYRGALSYGYEEQYTLYGEDAERDQVGCLRAVTKGSRHFVLELPFPRFESYHDVIELEPLN